MRMHVYGTGVELAEALRESIESRTWIAVQRGRGRCVQRLARPAG